MFAPRACAVATGAAVGAAPRRQTVASRAIARIRSRAALLALLAMCGGCSALPPDNRAGVPVAEVHELRLAAVTSMEENSAAAASVAAPGVFFTINDSGNDPALLAFDTTGADRGRWLLRGVSNHDWEAAAIGACSPGSRASCVFVGDVGDNMLRRATVVIFRVREPTLLPPQTVGALSPDSLVVRYPDAPHNVEAMYLAADGALLLISKEEMRDASGATRPALLYRIPASAWAAGAVAEAALADSLPIVPRSAPGRAVTDASHSPDGRYLAVRTYAQLYVFVTDSLTGLPKGDVAPAICNLSALNETQGEGVGFLTWRGPFGRFVFTSEGRHERARIANCPLPRLLP